MDIGLVLTTDKGLKAVLLPEEMLLKLVKTLKDKGNEWVHLGNGQSYLVDGIYIPGKGNKSAIMILPDIAED